MIKILYIFLSFMLVSCCGIAQDYQSLLWEINGNGLEQASYVYGTMHVQDERVFQFGDSTLAKLDECEALALELVIDDPFSMMSDIFMDSGLVLKDLISEDQYLKVKKLAEERMGLTAYLTDRLKPVFTVSELALGGTNKDKVLPLDLFLQMDGKSKGKKLIGIETPEEQTAALNKITLEEQLKMLTDFAEEVEKNDSLMEEEIKLYLKQDLDNLLNIMSEQDMPDNMNDHVLVKRNYTMAARIDSIIRLQSTFCAIGAGHLPGEEGVIALLKEKGYTVSPVFSPFKLSE